MQKKDPFKRDRFYFLFLLHDFTLLVLDLANTEPATDFFFAPNLLSRSTFDAELALIVGETLTDEHLFLEPLDMRYGFVV